MFYKVAATFDLKKKQGRPHVKMSELELKTFVFNDMRCIFTYYLLVKSHSGLSSTKFLPNLKQKWAQINDTDYIVSA